ncbi:DMT family permease [Companilactobacillus nodensis DSM 19682 = JCM 14932 = NBRC 107160]|uniref:DMT family permease n=1 Tax=Companilactobacillus nodensis DSM 19682 = JCM 14932 = NBRC 107160 TaxID=1423775 RepID=A0A0R1KG56_9LACO|nr:DMT family permease [Companilactobacillus nodensis DSM 19682 = JCM 14932 = NBRC 107160]
MILALIGTFLLVTNGNLNGLVLSPLALFWGVMSGVASATYTLLPRGLLRKYDARSVVGWAMLISSFSFIGEVTTKPLPKLNLMGVLCILFIIIFGTMFAYLFYLSSLRDLSPSTTSMLSSFEPLTATILSVTLLSTPFTIVQLIGGILILSTTFLQALPTKTIEHSEQEEVDEEDTESKQAN